MMDSKSAFRIAALICTVLLLIAATSQREVSWPNEIRHADTNITYDDGDVTATATAPIVHGLDCGQTSGTQFGAVNQELYRCYVPRGYKHIIRSATYFPYQGINADQKCLIGIATRSDFSAYVIGDLAAWSQTEIGDTTTATCDEGSISDDDLDEAGDWCRNTPPAPVELVFGETYTFMIDEVSAADCDQLHLVVSFERDIVKLD